MTEMTLDASLRTGTGKGVARKLRRQGLVPGIIYGVGDPLPIQFDAPSAVKLVQRLHGSERLIALKISDDKGGKAQQRMALLKSVQRNPVGTVLLHIDFHEVDVSKPVQVSVTVHTNGEAAGEKAGGIMQTVGYEIVVECLPTAIPEYIEVDVSAMQIGDSLHVGDLTLPEGVTAVTPEDETIVTVVAPRAEEPEEEEEAAAEEGEAAEAAEPEGEGGAAQEEAGEE